MQPPVLDRRQKKTQPTLQATRGKWENYSKRGARHKGSGTILVTPPARILSIESAIAFISSWKTWALPQKITNHYGDPRADSRDSWRTALPWRIRKGSGSDLIKTKLSFMHLFIQLSFIDDQIIIMFTKYWLSWMFHDIRYWKMIYTN